MAPKPPAAILRVSALLLMCAFAGSMLASPVFASGVRDGNCAPARVAPAQAQAPAPDPSEATAATPPPASTETNASSVVAPARTSRGLLPLFASYAVLQALDVHSTLSAIHAGGTEANGLVSPLVGHPAAFIAFKAAMTTGTIAAAERLSKHNRLAAYGLMFAANSAYAWVAVHNYRIAGR